jgi:hypothetical protein
MGGCFNMAEKKKSQVRLAKLVAPALPKGERPRVVVWTQTPMPMWGYVILVVGFLLGGFGVLFAYAAVTLTRKKFVLVLTGTSVFVVRLRKRPFRVVAAYPHGAVPISDVMRGRLWINFQLQLPDHAAPIALHTGRTSKAELDYIVAQADPALTEVDPWARADPAGSR